MHRRFFSRALFLQEFRFIVNTRSLVCPVVFSLVFPPSSAPNSVFSMFKSSSIAHKRYRALRWAHAYRPRRPQRDKLRRLNYLGIDERERDLRQPIDGRFAVPLKMQSDMRSARRDLWLCSPRTQEMASTMLDLPQPLGPMMQVSPLPLKVI